VELPYDIAISDFTYDLPEDRIAAFPGSQRDASKLLVYRDGQITDSIFSNICNYLPSGSLLVFNDTKVVNARLHFVNDRGKLIEVFCLGPANQHTDPSAGMKTVSNIKWRCLVGNLRQWKQDRLVLRKNNVELTAAIVSREVSHVDVHFSWTPEELLFSEVLAALGNIPIPPYLKRDSSDEDKQRYQTVYARAEGSVAAPTAGLHFTNALLDELKQKGVNTLPLTLHVGAGTFMPVKSATLAGHTMHAEWIELGATALRTMQLALDRSLIAVGTTSLRILESIYWMGLKAHYMPDAALSELEVGQWEPYTLRDKALPAIQSLNALLAWMDRKGVDRVACSTSILIAPPYQLKMARGLITNFHQPQSTLLLLVAALVGDDWKRIYDHALRSGYRFLSFGDASLLLK
jgi:S-adenosylmethionine:tRNA ribosyltransferase-isomerase